MRHRSASLFLLLALSACGEGESEVGPGGVSAEDAEALDKAAEKLDSEAAIPPNN
ncbi:MAG TPA: hypothetical protein VGN36_01530 [Sphingorhabdus sp.]|nr:hypothetical protein [Sphingorhabdus sp.]